MGMNVGSKGSMSDINVTPYIDILLVLLIVFMIITPIRQLELEVKVPQASPEFETALPDPNVIVVTINERAEIAINTDPYHLSELGAALLQIYSERSNKAMFISASPKLTYGDVVRIIDIAKGAGVGDIGLLTEIN